MMLSLNHENRNARIQLHNSEVIYCSHTLAFSLSLGLGLEVDLVSA